MGKESAACESGVVGARQTGVVGALREAPLRAQRGAYFSRTGARERMQLPTKVFGLFLPRVPVL